MKLHYFYPNILFLQKIKKYRLFIYKESVSKPYEKNFKLLVPQYYRKDKLTSFFSYFKG